MKTKTLRLCREDVRKAFGFPTAMVFVFPKAAPSLAAQP